MIFSYLYNNLGGSIGNLKYSFSFLNLIFIILKDDITNYDDNKLEKLKNKILFNGPISLKFMQWFLSKKSLENKEGKYDKIIEKFDDIFENCPFHSLEESIRIFEEDFKVPMSSVIQMDSIEELASGSIGQVYKCRLVDGKEIALKVQHPNNGDITNNQFKIVNFCIYLQKVVWIKNLLMLHMDIEDFMYNLLLQMDFTIEAYNTLKFAKNFEGNRLVIIPKLYYFSSRILISEFQDGEDYDDLPEYQKVKVGMNFYCCLMQMNFHDDFTHGDLHKKNWKVRKLEDTKDYQIIFYDFGIVFSTGSIDKNIDLWESFQENDMDRILSILPYIVISKDKRKDTFLNENTKQLITALFNSQFCTTDIITTLTQILAKEKLYINRVFLNILLIMTLCEKIFIQIDFINRYYPPSLEKRMRNIAARYGDILAFVKKNPYYPTVMEYVENKYNSYQIDNLFSNHNNKLEFDDPLSLDLDNPLSLELDDPTLNMHEEEAEKVKLL
tara:strand:- start:108 stop:1601 length:1494 start_codon:yes stop_codon:yes gene_type:complete